jgi:EmrB/QacA subfamily drug resistance transporter
VSSPSTAPVSLARNPIFVSLLVASAFFMENLDGTVIATALPQMAQSFGTNAVDLNTGMTAYMLTLAVFIPVSGWVADRLGARTVFGGAITVFTLASVLCGLSSGVWEFTAARILQGIGGAMMVPVGRLVVLRTTAKEDLMRAVAYITWPGLVAPIIGPPLGGFITTYASWRWIFFLNVPLGIAGFILTCLWVANRRDEKLRIFDWLGFLLSGTACTSLMYGLELIGHETQTRSRALFYLAGSLVLGAFAVWHSQRHSHPLIDLTSLHIKTFAVSIRGGSLFRISISVAPFLLPLMFQFGFGLSAFQSGLLVLAVFAGNLGMKTVTTPVLRHFGFRTVLIVNGIITGFSILACGLLTPQTPRTIILAVLFISGLCRSMQFTSLTTLAFSDIPSSHMSAATTFSSMVTQMTGGMGVAVGAIALRLAALFRGEAGTTPTLPDFRIAFLLVSLLAFAAVIDCFTLASSAGAQVSGHRQRS